MNGTSRMSYLMLFLLYLTTSFVYTMENLMGSRAPCTNEGEEIVLDANLDINCFRCICQNGFVECETESCPAIDDCYALIKKPEGGCCDKCKECVYNGKAYASGSEWSNPEDPCSNYKCVAGVVTESNMLCYTSCSNPLPPRPGKCCPTCLGCHLSGRAVFEEREVTMTEDPCVKCQCSGKRLTCMKKACPVLTCPKSVQRIHPGECCPKCSKTIPPPTLPKGGCLVSGGFHQSIFDKRIQVDDNCATCTCFNESTVCQKKTCPVLECALEFQQPPKHKDCCPTCPLIAEVRSTCTFNGKTYQNNETWNMNPCRSCECRNGEIRCAQPKCENVKCKSNQKLTTPPGQCCAICEETPGVCTVFGDPHYKTFDGKFFSFQGTCKYQLTADCVGHTFSIRVTNDARSTKFSSWTKTVTLKMEHIKINLGQKLRVKVNGTRVDLPYQLDDVVSINRNDQDEIIVHTEIGVKLNWDGYNFLQVQVPVEYKNKLCGLCGNYNNVWRDDLTSRNGLNMTDNEVKRFADSWRVGGLRACARKPNEIIHKPPHCQHKQQKKANAHCRELKESVNNIFENCQSRVNPDKYFEFCKMDMCECPSQMCYCESFTAYAHECERNGVHLPRWREDTRCKLSSLYSNRNSGLTGAFKHEKLGMKRHNQRRKGVNNQPDLMYKHKHVPKTFAGGLTALPLH